MTHRFPIKEIARQAGLGPATIDRVLNNRAHVSAHTRARVMAALDELEAQETQLAARGRRVFVDVVIEAPARFSTEVQKACEAVLPSIGFAVFRPRFVRQEHMTGADVTALIDRILRRGSGGVCLKLRDTVAARDGIARLRDAGIPVATLVNDLPRSVRSAYVGLDNANAGRVAAYLLGRSVAPGQGGTILINRSQADFFGETERWEAFRDELARTRPDWTFLDMTGGGGLTGPTLDRLDTILSGADRVRGVYSAGGGNRAILRALSMQSHEMPVFIAHDLDAENRALLAERRIDFVLHHDLRTDMANMLRAIGAAHGLTPKMGDRLISDIHVVTPYNVPGASADARRADAHTFC